MIADLCFCEYTDHGHCGPVLKQADGNFVVDNDATLELLAKQAVSLAQAGADVIAPSGSMDGVVHAVSTPESRQCRSRCLVQTWARWNIFE